ncbi:MAG: hypothetical protein UZ11_BCD004000413 [Bacteroidetes bacterium OLB11]|nr:MAG: hypothetical protein UZ11_BCD004000413 [Bacteroidetes bacterium OLB11]
MQNIIKKYCLFFTQLLLVSSAIAQNKIIESQSSQVADKNKLTHYEELTNENIPVNEVYKVERRDLANYQMPQVEILNIKTTKINNPKYPDSIQFPKAITPTVFISMERKQAFASILIPQYIQQNDNSIEKVVSYELSVHEKQTANKTSGNRVYASNSVLASGSFYRIAIKTQGIYKIDYSFIKNTMGINPSDIQMSHIRLYGNGGEMLDENNATPRPDDLTENAIQVVDDGDGIFGENDYILFYANGPHSILNDSVNKKFTHVFNIYSEESHYFLNFDKGVGKRISLQNNPPTANTNSNSFNDFLFYEKDSVNLGKFGKMWWGDEFSDLPGRYLNRNYSFSFPNIDETTPIKITAHVGAISYSGMNNMSISVNGGNTQNISLQSTGPNFYNPVIVAQTKEFTANITNPSVSLNLNFTKGSSSAVGYLDYLEINARRKLIFNGHIVFADWNTVGIGNIANYQIQQANANTQVWDITNPLEPIQMQSNMNGGLLSFKQDASTLHRFIAFDGSITNTPQYLEKAINQNLHSITPKKYIIISPASLLSEAEKLASYHQTKRGYSYVIVTPQQIYNEFSSGTQDVSAIRDFVKNAL